jgi:hypothetical protein
METAQHWDKLPKNQPAEITMFQISEVQESPAFNGRRSFWPYGHRRSLRCCVPRHPEGFCASTRHRDIILFQQRLKSVIMKEWKQLRARNEDTTTDSNRS